MAQAEDDELRSARERRAAVDTAKRRDVNGNLLCAGVLRRRDSDPTSPPVYCNNPVVENQTRCEVHLLVQGRVGVVRTLAQTPNSKAAQIQRARVRTQNRLAALVDPAIAVLAREMIGADKSSDRQAAANSLLDRAGWGRVQKVEHADARDLLLQRLLEMRQAAPIVTVENVHGIEVPPPTLDAYSIESSDAAYADEQAEDPDDALGDEDLSEGGLTTLVEGVMVNSERPEAVVAEVVKSIEADAREKLSKLLLIEGTTDD